MKDENIYVLLQNFASPIVAITSKDGNDINGMIANSAVRASLVPEMPRVSFYCFKQHYSHQLISNSGRFCMHLLHRTQFHLIRALGFDSGKETAKMDKVDWTAGTAGIPVLEESYAWFQCKVINGMDAGPSTFFLGEVEETGMNENVDRLEVMDSNYFRQNMPEEWIALYRENKREVQKWASTHAEVDPEWCWKG